MLLILLIFLVWATATFSITDCSHVLPLHCNESGNTHPMKESNSKSIESTSTSVKSTSTSFESTTKIFFASFFFISEKIQIQLYAFLIKVDLALISDQICVLKKIILKLVFIIVLKHSKRLSRVTTFYFHFFLFS